MNYRVYQAQTDVLEPDIFAGEWVVQQKDRHGHWRNVTNGFKTEAEAVTEMEKIKNGQALVRLSKDSAQCEPHECRSAALLGVFCGDLHLPATVQPQSYYHGQEGPRISFLRRLNMLRSLAVLLFLVAPSPARTIGLGGCRS